MDLDEIKSLIALMDEASLTEIEVENSERRLRLKREAPGMQPLVQALPVAAPEAASEKEAAASEEQTNLHQVESPIVGTFYMSASPTATAYVALGDLVKKGQVLCIVEAMKLMNEIESDVDGRIVKIFHTDGTAVEYGEVLFAIEPA